MKEIFCTLLNKNYLSRGITLYESLKKVTQDFLLYALAFDNMTFAILSRIHDERLIPIRLEDCESSELLKVKPNRTLVEYCWTLTPHTIKYILEKFGHKRCTYIDADIYFFSDPKKLLNELGNKSVLITEHRYTSKYNQSATSGKYCVQFITITNNAKGLEVLNWWCNSCIKWCFNRFEDGKFGDQKYLDDWTTRFQGVHELVHIGGGVAPWNVQQYNIKEDSGLIKVIYKDMEYDLVFYHFHGFKIYKNYAIDYAHYELNKDVINTIYKVYLKHLLEVEKRYINFEDKVILKRNLIFFAKMARRYLKRHYIKDLLR